VALSAGVRVSLHLHAKLNVTRQCCFMAPGEQIPKILRTIPCRWFWGLPGQSGQFMFSSIWLRLKLFASMAWFNIEHVLNMTNSCRRIEPFFSEPCPFLGCLSETLPCYQGAVPAAQRLWHAGSKHGAHRATVRCLSIGPALGFMVYRHSCSVYPMYVGMLLGEPDTV